MKKHKKWIISLVLISGVAILAPLDDFWTTFRTTLKKRQELLELWRCAVMPKKYVCSPSQIKRSRRWLISGSVTAIAAALTAVGIGVMVHQVRKQREKVEEGLDFFARERPADWRGQPSQPVTAIVSEEEKFPFAEFPEVEEDVLERVRTESFQGKSEEIKTLDLPDISEMTEEDLLKEIKEYLLKAINSSEKY